MTRQLDLNDSLAEVSGCMFFDIYFCGPHRLSRWLTT